MSDVWACSSTFGIAIKDVRSDALLRALAWDTPVRPGAVAYQLVQLGTAYAAAEAAAAEAARVAEAAQGQSAQAQAQAQHSTPPLLLQQQADAAQRGVAELRSALTSECPKMYGLLNAHVGRRELDTVARALGGGKAWLWVGDGFVGTGQVAFDAPDNARPYLHRVPPSMELFEPLLRALGVRDRFAPEDFVRTLATLKKQTTATAGSTEKSSKLDDA